MPANRYQKFVREMSKHSALRKIEFNINNGLKLKAAVQLGTLINKNPNNIELRNRLAELYFEAGFLDAAGKFWILNDSKDQNVKRCVEIYEKSVNHSGNRILLDLKFRGDKTLLSRYAQNKLAELEKDSLDKTNSIPDFKEKENEHIEANTKKNNPILEKLGCGIAIAIVLFLVAAVIIGSKAIFQWLF